MAMNNQSRLTLVTIQALLLLLMMITLSFKPSTCQQHPALHTHPATLLLDIDTSASAADSPIVCQGDSLSNNFHRNQHPVKVITEDADLFIGALLNVHETRAGGGFFSCGNVTASGLIAYEALNWISSTINQEHGVLNGKPVVESFIPGVRIGKRSFRCQRERLPPND